MTDFSGQAARENVRVARLINLFAPGVWDWDTRAGSFTATETALHVFGFATSHPIDFDKILAVTHPDDRAWGEKIKDAQYDWASDPLVVRFRIFRADTGKQRWLSSRIWRHLEVDTGATSGYTATVTDVTEEIVTATALAQSEQRLRLAIEAGKMAVWEVDLENKTMTQSTELNLLFGFPSDFVMTLEAARSCYNPGEIERLEKEQHTAEAVQRRAAEGAFEPWHPDALKGGADRTQVQAEVAITTNTGQPKHLMLRAQYAISPEGRPRLTGLIFDITETKMAEERSAVVARELQHRVKNSLSVVSAIAMQTFRSASEQDSLKSYLGRLSALAAANELILSGETATANLHGLIEKIIRPYRTETSMPFLWEGPPVHLPPYSATATGMVFHELCTNAVKYGALSASDGVVGINWTKNAPDRLSLIWHERGGPRVSPPSRRGFGIRLLENMVKTDLNGTLELDFKPQGLICRIEMRTDR